jgi:hypothetical protein
MLKHKICFEKRVNFTCEVGLRASPWCEGWVLAAHFLNGGAILRQAHSLNMVNSPFKIVKQAW